MLLYCLNYPDNGKEANRSLWSKIECMLMNGADGTVFCETDNMHLVRQVTPKWKKQFVQRHAVLESVDHITRPIARAVGREERLKELLRLAYKPSLLSRLHVALSR